MFLLWHLTHLDVFQCVSFTSTLTALLSPVLTVGAATWTRTCSRWEMFQSNSWRCKVCPNHRSNLFITSTTCTVCGQRRRVLQVLLCLWALNWMNKNQIYTLVYKSEAFTFKPMEVYHKALCLSAAFLYLTCSKEEEHGGFFYSISEGEPVGGTRCGTVGGSWITNLP